MHSIRRNTGSASLPPLQGLSVNNSRRGVKRSAPSNSAEREQNVAKWQSLCSAPWSLMLDGAIKTLGPHLYIANAQTTPSRTIKYEHEFCWRDSETGELDDTMVFGVYGNRVHAADRWLYVIRPTLRSSNGSENSWLWATMRQELGYARLTQTVLCDSDVGRLNAALNAALRPWIEFFVRHFETDS